MKIKIDGMSCNHCKIAVEKVLSKISNIESYSVNLGKGEVIITGNPARQVVIDEINKIGYKATFVE